MTDSEASSSAEAPASAPRSTGKRLVRGAGATLAVMLGLLLGVLLLLQTDWGATHVAQWAADRFNPVPGTTITVDRASGSWLGGVALYGVTWTLDESAASESAPPPEQSDEPTLRAAPRSGEQLATIDTVEVGYRLPALLGGTLHLTRAHVGGPAVYAMQMPDSTWNWTQALEPLLNAPPDTSTADPLRIQLDQARISRGYAEIAFHGADADSTAYIDPLTVAVRDVDVGASVRATLDTLHLRGELPTSTTTPLTLRAGGALSPERLTVRALQLDAPRSRLRSQGQVQFARDPLAPSTDSLDTTLSATTFTLQADSLAIADLVPFVPSLAPAANEVHRGTVHIEQEDAQWRLRGTGSVNTGGTWQANASARRPAAGDSLRYMSDLSVTGYETQLAGLRTRLNAELRADLAGPSHNALSGTATFAMHDAQVDTVRIDTLGIAATATEGEVAWRSQGQANGTTLTSTGTAQPFAETPTYALDAQLQALAVERWLPESGVTSNINARLQVNGSGVESETRSASAQLSMYASTLNGTPVDTLDLAATLNGAQVQSTFDLAVVGGRVTGAARTTLDDRETFAIERLETTNFNLNALLNDDALPTTRLTAQLQAEGQGFTPATMQLQGEARITETTYGQLQVDTLATTWRLRDGALQTQLQMQSNAGGVDLQATGRPFDTPLALQLTEGRLRSVNIGPFMQDTTQTSALTGTIRGRWAQSQTSAATGQVALALSDSKLNDQSITEAQLNASLGADERLTFDTRLRTPEGATTFAGTAQPVAERPTLQITDGQIEGLNVGALLGQPTLDTDLNGTVALSAAGQALRDLALEGRLALADSRINKAALPEASWTVQAEAGQLSSTLDARFDLGTLHADLTSNLADSTYTLAVEADEFDGAALTGEDSLRANLGALQATLDGRGFAPETAEFTAALDASTGTYGPVEMSAATLRTTYERGRLSLDTLQVDSNVLTATGTGTVELRGQETNSDITLTADVRSVAPVQELAGFETLALERGHFTGRLQGAAEALRFNGQFEAENVLVEGTRIGESETIVAGAFNAEYVLDRMEARTTNRYVNTAGIPMNRVQARGTYQSDEGFTVRTDMQIDSNRRIQLAASALSPEDNRLRATLEQLDVELGASAWSLMQPVALSQDGSAFQIRNFLLAASDQQIAIDGRVDFEGGQDLGITLENVQAAPFADVMALEGLSGTLNGDVDLTGPADDPVANARLRAAIQSENVDVGTLDTQVTYRDFGLAIEGRLAHADGSTLTVEGDFPIDLRLDTSRPASVMDTPVDLRLNADAFAIGWIDPFLDPTVMQDLQGRMQANVRIGGTRNNPDVQGEATLNSLSLVLTELGSRYRNGRAALRLQDNRITITESEIRSAGQGRMTATGTVELEELTLGTIDLDVQASNFQAVDTRAYRQGTINGDLAVQGTTERPSVTGTIQVVRADISYDELDTSGAADLATVALTEADRADLERRFGVRLSDADTTAYDAYQAMAMDLSVEIRRETWLRSRSSLGLNIQFSGDLDLQKAHDEDLELYGSIDIVPERSTVEQFGQVFRVDEGVLTFNGPVDDPQMSFAAVYEQRARETRDTEVAITLNGEGRLGDLDLNFSSEPPMSTSNILSYLATGRPADNLLGGGGGGTTGGSSSGDLATQLAIGQASNFVENLAASQLGLDVVRLQVRPNGISYLTVGRYFTPRFYVSIEQPVDTGSSETEVLDPDLLMEYELTRTLIARVLRRQSSLRFNVLYERAY
ncbi:hypothetical protein CRI93_02330 [Longimonas halophila]|uniref:Translocation and assembly module TamB C-terminal domain-containing protein n=1 Tax=Longimonas halophila TaxID=1469170 RepID=A0A2H3NQV2_9BACT|nr:translocation/assembly module TamB [Longimonas halophila]PEN09587.1 hypothetical protein CRI93_02330 [Longimonas halophila]